MSTQLIKPIFCISLTRRRSTTEKQTSLFVLKGINFQPLLPAFTKKGIDRVNCLTLLKAETGKLTKIPDFFLVKPQEINITEKKFY